MGPPKFTRDSAMAEGPRDALLSRNSATTVHNIPFETRVPGLSCGIICEILRLAVFTQYRSVTDTHAQTDRWTDRYMTTACIASRGKNRPYAYCTAYQVHYQATSVS